jgi:hypothetical protein
VNPVGDGGHGLRARPEPDPVIVAMVASAVDQLFSGTAAPSADDAFDPAHQAWRFSGRWWARPLPVRRRRPWVGGGPPGR